MGMSVGGGGGRGRIAQSTLAEINVTPLVDVMLVLLVIFMTASSVETARLSREAETLRQVVSEEIAAVDAPPDDQNQVPIDLPKAEADRIIAGGKQGKPVLAIDGQRRIFLDQKLLVACKGLDHFDSCLDTFEAALAKAAPGGLRDVHFKADRRLSYDEVLRLMARMRRAGIQHFGLVTEAPKAAGGAAK
ncbi:MAG: biopolymer transporter ExbD [Deltaproteobacteria bacterium]|nr:biopolymer transporter ExbD [Deltaproteobacteria bacterium]